MERGLLHGAAAPGVAHVLLLLFLDRELGTRERSPNDSSPGSEQWQVITSAPLTPSVLKPARGIRSQFYRTGTPGFRFLMVIGIAW